MPAIPVYWVVVVVVVVVVVDGVDVTPELVELSLGIVLPEEPVLPDVLPSAGRPRLPVPPVLPVPPASPVAPVPAEEPEEPVDPLVPPVLLDSVVLVDPEEPDMPDCPPVDDWSSRSQAARPRVATKASKVSECFMEFPGW